ncbi:hypothetical protein D9M71_366400 [compost metagenome]
MAWKSLITIPLVVSLSACVQSSGVLQLGPDTYSVSVHAAPARGGVSGAKEVALTEASSACHTQNKEILVTNLSSGPSAHFPGGTVDVTFQCLDRQDRALQRPTYSPAPDVLIKSQD